MSTIIFTGAQFHSSDDFRSKLAEFERENFCSFVMKSSTKSETDNKTRKRPIPVDKFDLARGTVVCAHFGEKRQYRTKGVKTCTTSQKLHCSAAFSFTFDDFNQCLVVTSCNLEHNHVTDQSTFSQQLQQKQFSEDEKAVLKEVIALNPDNEKLLAMVQKDFQKSLCLRDIRRLKRKYCHKSSASDSIISSNIGTHASESLTPDIIPSISDNCNITNESTVSSTFKLTSPPSTLQKATAPIFRGSRKRKLERNGQSREEEVWIKYLEEEIKTNKLRQEQIEEEIKTNKLRQEQMNADIEYKKTKTMYYLNKLQKME